MRAILADEMYANITRPKHRVYPLNILYNRDFMKNLFVASNSSYW